MVDREGVEPSTLGLRVKLSGVSRCVNVFRIGCTTWDPIDLAAFTTRQMSKRYGFIHVNRNDDGTGDLHRVRKDSFFWYQRAIASDGTDLD